VGGCKAGCVAFIHTTTHPYINISICILISHMGAEALCWLFFFSRSFSLSGGALPGCKTHTANYKSNRCGVRWNCCKRENTDWVCANALYLSIIGVCQSEQLLSRSLQQKSGALTHTHIRKQQYFLFTSHHHPFCMTNDWRFPMP